jgi:hypothetical protein
VRATRNEEAMQRRATEKDSNVHWSDSFEQRVAVTGNDISLKSGGTKIVMEDKHPTNRPGELSGTALGFAKERGLLQSQISGKICGFLLSFPLVIILVHLRSPNPAKR